MLSIQEEWIAGYLASEQKPWQHFHLLCRQSNEYSVCFKAPGSRDCVSKKHWKKSQTHSSRAVFVPEGSQGQGGKGSNENNWSLAGS